MSVTGLLHLSFYGFILTTHALQHQRVRPNGMAILPCGDLKVGKVTWSRDMKGRQVSILSTDNGEIIRHMNNNNHSTLPDLSLIIWFVSFWDEGLYYCNGTPVACLTVKPALQHQRVRPNGMAILPCGDLKVGKVTWSRDMKGRQVSILSTDNGEIIRHMNNNNHSTLPDLSLIIWFVSFWDEGLYYCNGTPVACLTVKPADGQNIEDLTECLKGAVHVNVVEQVLMFGGVGLAALMFLFATAAAVQALYSSNHVKQRAHTTDHFQTLETDVYYINLREQQ